MNRSSFNTFVFPVFFSSLAIGDNSLITVIVLLLIVVFALCVAGKCLFGRRRGGQKVAGGGVGVSPRRVSGGAKGAAGPGGARFFRENGEKKHEKDFEAEKEQGRIDNQGQNVNT